VIVLILIGPEETTTTAITIRTTTMVQEAGVEEEATTQIISAEITLAMTILDLDHAAAATMDLVTRILETIISVIFPVMLRKC
jgi:hypothetical protein